MQKKGGGGQLSLFAQDGYAGKMCLEASQAERRRARISASSCRSSQALAAVPFLSLDLTPGSGNLLGEFYWETLSPWLGGALTHNTGGERAPVALWCEPTEPAGETPQRRTRILLVADFAGTSAPQILFD